MTCKFAEICHLYKPEQTCKHDNGGPFMISLFPRRIKAYCGYWNYLNTHPEAVERERLEGQAVLVEA